MTGRGKLEEVSVRMDKAERAAGAPLPDPPPQTTRGRENGTGRKEGNRILPSPRGTSGEGSGEGPPADASESLFVEPPHRAAIPDD
jgi:hypothetical protein